MNTTKKLNEMSSITRLMQFMDEFEIACITANRNNLSKDENERRNRELSSSLLHRGYGITRINGNYIENFGTIDAIEVSENSYFVVNLSDDTEFFNVLFKASEYYDQDSFLYKPSGKDEEAYLIGTAHNAYPGYKVREPLGKLHINVESEFLSRIKKNSFSFTDEPSDKPSARPLSFADRKEQRKQKITDALNLDTFKKHTLYGKQAIATIGRLLDEALKNSSEHFSFESLIENFVV